MVLIYDFRQSIVVIVITFLNKENKAFSILPSASLVYLIKDHSIDYLFVFTYLFVKNVTFDYYFRLFICIYLFICKKMWLDYYLLIIFVNHVTGFYLFILMLNSTLLFSIKMCL